MNYVWKEGRSRLVNANVVGEAIEGIIERDGDCKPIALVKAAKLDSSPLHPLFEWKNGVAAERWREHQARNVMNSLRVIVVDHQDETPLPAFLSVRTVETTDDGDESVDDGYHARRIVEVDPSKRRAHIVHEFRVIRGHLNRVSWVPEFTPLLEAAAHVEATLFDVADPTTVSVLVTSTESEASAADY